MLGRMERAKTIRAALQTAQRAVVGAGRGDDASSNANSNSNSNSATNACGATAAALPPSSASSTGRAATPPVEGSSHSLPRTASTSHEPSQHSGAAHASFASSDRRVAAAHLRTRSQESLGSGSVGSTVAGGGAGVGLGVEVELRLQRTSPNEPLGLTIDSRSCWVDAVEEKSPAGRAGVEVGMHILVVNGHPVASFDDIRGAIGGAPPGADVVMTLRDPRIPNSRHLMILQQDDYAELSQRHTTVRNAEREESAVESKAARHAAQMKKSADQARAAAQQKAGELKKMKDQIAKSQAAQDIIELEGELREKEAQVGVGLVNYKQTEGAIHVSIKNLKADKRRYLKLLDESIGDDDDAGDDGVVITGDSDMKLKIQLHQLEEELKVRQKTKEKRSREVAHLDSVLQNKQTRLKDVEQRVKETQQHNEKLEADRERLTEQIKQLQAQRARQAEHHQEVEKRLADSIEQVEVEKQKKLADVKTKLAKERDAETTVAKRISDVQIATQTIKSQGELFQKELSILHAEDKHLDENEQVYMQQIKEGQRYRELWREGQCHLSEIATKVARAQKEHNDYKLMIEGKYDPEIKRLASLISERAKYLKATTEEIADLDNEIAVKQNVILAYKPKEDAMRELEQDIDDLERGIIREHETAVALTQETLEAQEALAATKSEEETMRVHISRLATAVRNAEEEQTLRREEREAVVAQHRQDRRDIDTDATIVARKATLKLDDLRTQLAAALKREGEARASVTLLEEHFGDRLAKLAAGSPNTSFTTDGSGVARGQHQGSARSLLGRSIVGGGRSCLQMLGQRREQQEQLDILEEKLAGADRIRKVMREQAHQCVKNVEQKDAMLAKYFTNKDEDEIRAMVRDIQAGIATLREHNAQLKERVEEQRAGSMER